MIYLFQLMALILFPLISYGAFDLKTGLQGRSYPGIGASATLTAGLNMPLWGELAKGKVNYGLLRFQSEFASSAVVYHQDHSVTLYPISFLGFGVGNKQMTSNFEDFVFYDCTQVRCVGEMNKDYAFGKVILGFRGIIGSFSYMETRNQYTDPENTGQGVAEYEHVSVVASGEESSTERKYILAYKLDSNVIGALSQTVEYHSSEQKFNFHILFYNMQSDNLKLTLGAGSLYSTYQEPGPVLVFQLSYSFIDNLALF
jgi:hypothetical protein